MTTDARVADTKAIMEVLVKLPTGVKETLAANFAGIEMAYRAGYVAGRQDKEAA